MGSYELEIRSRDDGHLMVRAEFPAGDAGRMAAWRARWLRADRGGSVYYSVTAHPDGRVTDSRLTAGQQRLMDRLRETGKPLVLNGRAQKPVEVLERLGLVTVDWDANMQVKGGGMELAQRITVTLAPAVQA